MRSVADAAPESRRDCDAGFDSGGDAFGAPEAAEESAPPRRDAEADILSFPSADSGPSADATTDASPLDGATPPSPPDQAWSYLINASHTNSVAGVSLAPPLARRWTAHLPGTVSYPLIADGRIFVVAQPSAASTMDASPPQSLLVALDAQTGNTVWSAPLIAGFAAHAYDNGRVFTVDGAGTVNAFDAATGQRQWSRSTVTSYSWSFFTVPTAYRGVLYTSAAGDGGTLFGFDEVTGQLLFKNVDFHTGDGSPPAVADDGFVVAYACEQTYKHNRLTGDVLWHYSTSCSGGGGDIPVLSGGHVYVTEMMGNVVLDAASGSSVGTFAATQSPAFDGAFAFFVAGSQLTAVDLASGQTSWTFALNNGQQFATAPLLAGGYVYTVDFAGTVAAFDKALGRMVWSDTTSLRIQGTGIAPVAMAASAGLLVVPEGSSVVAYGSSGDGGIATDASSGSGDASACVWTMQQGQKLTTGNSPYSEAIGDFNRDGKPDIAVANFESSPNVVPFSVGTVSVFLGNGDGTFQAPASYSTAPGTVAVAVADLNQDGIADLAVANRGLNPYTFNPPPGTVSVLLGNGDGTFRSQVSYPTSPNSLAIAVGDLNRDGRPDIAVAIDGHNTLSVLLGNGDGTLQSAINYGTAVGYSVAIGDLNADGAPDLVAATFDNNVSVFLNAGDGTFKAAVAYPSFSTSSVVTETDSAAIGDFNGDGNSDLAVANWGTSNVSVLLGNGDGTFRPQVPYATNGGPESVTAADMNGDGNLDLVVADGLSSPDVSVLLGNGDGTFQPQGFFGVGGNTSSIAIGDLNGDHKPDLVANAGAQSVSLLVNSCRH